MAVMIALQNSKLGILQTLSAVFWSKSQGPCTNCLVYGFLVPEIPGYPGNGHGLCSNHVATCQDGDDCSNHGFNCAPGNLSAEEIGIQAPLFLAAYENYLTKEPDGLKEIDKRAQRRFRARQKRKERVKMNKANDCF